MSLFKKDRALAVIACGALLACAPAPRRLTRDEWLAMRTHTFRETTAPKVYEAAEKVLKLVDSRSVMPRRTVDGVTASRAGATGYAGYSYSFKAVQDGSNVIAELAMTEYGNYMRGNYPVSFHEAYDLFFGRVEALLGTGEWRTCAEIPASERKLLDSLCYETDDPVPEGVRRK